MPSFWGTFARGNWTNSNGVHNQHNLQDGLFQIATQTCSLLVQVNNTNNISYGNNTTNIQCTSVLHNNSTNGASHSNSTSSPAKCSNISRNGLTSISNSTDSKTRNNIKSSDAEQLVVLIPPVNDTKVNNSSNNVFEKYRHRLSTVLENSIPVTEEIDLWNQGYTLHGDSDDGPVTRWNKKGWCKPSCIPISIILVLIFLVVLLPLLDHAMEREEHVSKITINSHNSVCLQSCRVYLTESLPEGLVYPNENRTFLSTYNTWLSLINSAKSTIEIASFYWTLRKSEIYPHNSSQEGEDIFQALLKAGTDRKIKLKIAQNAPTQSQPNIDTELLVKRKAAEVRSLNFAKLLGSGVLHTKLWIVDRKHFYLGSANMDWRSLTQVKELGAVVYNCSCLANDISKIFDVYWTLGENGASIPDKWPSELSTKFNIITPMNVTLNNYIFQSYISSSPPPFCPEGRSSDIDAIVNVITNAEKFVYVAVMDYFPLTIYTPREKFWPIIDDALRTAAIDNKVNVRLLISQWNHSRESENYFLKSLTVLTKSLHGVNIEVKHFIVPASPDQQKIPFARVNHNKYMVTDNTAYIGTSNWSGDYFIDTAGVGLIFHDPLMERNSTEPTIREQLQFIFERDWNSEYANPMKI